MGLCTHTGEVTLIRYIDGNLNNAEQIEFEKHLSECPDCLKEAVEVSRLEAAMDSGRPVPIREPKNIWVTIREMLIEGFQSSFGSGELLNAVAVRDGESVPKNRLEIVSDSGVKIQIIPEEGARFWIGIESERLFGKMIELREMPAKLPLFMKKASENALMIKSIRKGSYLLVIGQDEIDLKID